MPDLHSVPTPDTPKSSLEERRHVEIHRNLGWLRATRGHWEFDGHWSHYVLPHRWERFEVNLTLGPLFLHLFRRRAPEPPEPEEYQRLHVVDR